MRALVASQRAPSRAVSYHDARKRSKASSGLMRTLPLVQRSGPCEPRAGWPNNGASIRGSPRAARASGSRSERRPAAVLRHPLDLRPHTGRVPFAAFRRRRAQPSSRNAAARRGQCAAAPPARRSGLREVRTESVRVAPGPRPGDGAEVVAPWHGARGALRRPQPPRCAPRTLAQAVARRRFGPLPAPVTTRPAGGGLARSG